MANEYQVATVAAEALSAGSPAGQVAIIGAEVLRSTDTGVTRVVVAATAIEVLRSFADATSTVARRRPLILG